MYFLLQIISDFHKFSVYKFISQIMNSELFYVKVRNSSFGKLIPSEFMHTHCSLSQTWNLMRAFTSDVASLVTIVYIRILCETCHIHLKYKFQYFVSVQLNSYFDNFPLFIKFFWRTLEVEILLPKPSTFLQINRLLKCIAMKTNSSRIISSTVTPSQFYGNNPCLKCAQPIQSVFKQDQEWWLHFFRA